MFTSNDTAGRCLVQDSDSKTSLSSDVGELMCQTLTEHLLCSKDGAKCWHTGKKIVPLPGRLHGGGGLGTD